MKIGCKIESVVGVNFKKLLAKVVNLIFKYILSSYFVQCHLSSLNSLSTFFSLYLSLYICFTFFKLLEVSENWV